MAAAHGLSMLRDVLQSGEPSSDANMYLVCEHHEDWVIIADKAALIISAKHKEQVFVFSTVNSLTKEGGVGHLFECWVHLQQLPDCLLVTTAGCTGDAARLKELAAELHTRCEESVYSTDDAAAVMSKFHRALMSYCTHLPGDWNGDGAPPPGEPSDSQRATMAQFLSALAFQVEEIRRQHLPFAAPTMYLTPILKELGETGRPEPAWESVMSLFRSRMRAAGDPSDGALPRLSFGHYQSIRAGTRELDADIAKRIVYLTDIESAIRVGARNPDGFVRPPKTQRLSRLAVKMDVGGCEPNTIERAEELRQWYEEFWEGRIEVPGGLAAQRKMERYLLKVTDQATRALADDESHFGPKLWSQIEQRIDSDVSANVTEDDDDTLLGGISDLSNRCKVWFSEVFDIQEEIGRRQELEAGE